jgi:hypothetical protein
MCEFDLDNFFVSNQNRYGPNGTEVFIVDPRVAETTMILKKGSTEFDGQILNLASYLYKGTENQTEFRADKDLKN